MVGIEWEFGPSGMKMGKKQLKGLFPKVFSRTASGLSGMRMVKRGQKGVMFITL